jgi:SAM-dependent methyltransferase
MLYHTHHMRNPEDQHFWLGLAQRQGGSILELGCGTGRVLLPLAEAGYPVFGLDYDAQMLKYLQEITPATLRWRVNIFQGDICAYRLARQFSLILLPCNTYSTLAPYQRAQALERARQHLSSDGLFAVSMPNPALLDNLPRRSQPEIEEIFPHPLDGEPVQVSSAWKRTRQQVTFTWYYDHLLPDGSVQRTLHQVSHNIIPLEKILEEFSSAGMHVTDLYGDFDTSSFSTESTHLILLTVKHTPSRF